MILTITTIKQNNNNYNHKQKMIILKILLRSVYFIKHPFYWNVIPLFKL
jgi:hypothetical protein